MPPPGVAASGLGDLLARVAGAWSWRPAVLLVVGALAALYLRGWARLRRTPRTRGAAPGWRLAAYLIGLGSVFLALCSPLELLAELSFTAHMVQHQLLIMGRPPLLLLAAPFPVILWALPPPLRRRLRRTGGSPRSGAARPGSLTRMPVAGALYTVTLWGWHHPVAYEAALRYPVLHDIEHLTFFGTAVLFWWPIVNPAPRFRRLSSGLMYGARIGYLILATAQNTMLGAVLGLSERVFYPSYAAAPRLLGDWSPSGRPGVRRRRHVVREPHVPARGARAPPPGDGQRGAKGGCTGPPHRVGFAQSMLDIGIQELLVVMVLALLIFGPDKLPDLGRRLGRAMREFRRASDEFRSTVEQNLQINADQDSSPPRPRLPSSPRRARRPARCRRVTRS